MNRTTQLILVTLVILLVCSLCFAGYVWLEFPPFQPADTPGTLTPEVQIPTPTLDDTPLPECLVTDFLNLRTGPGTNYEPPIRVLPENTRLTPLARNNDSSWLQVQVTETEEIGWVSSEFVDCNLPLPDLPAGEMPLTPTPIPTATAAAAATPTPTVQPPTPTAETVRCPFETSNEFEAIWMPYENVLGCAKQPTVTAGLFVEQQFANGAMVWIGELDWFFVRIGDNDGRWYTFQDEAEFDARFTPNHEGPSCEPDRQPAPGEIQPIRGFGAIWCGEFKGTDFQSTLEFATEVEHGQLNNRFLAFDQGYILRDSQGRIVIFFADDADSGTYLVQE